MLKHKKLISIALTSALLVSSCANTSAEQINTTETSTSQLNESKQPLFPIEEITFTIKNGNQLVNEGDKNKNINILEQLTLDYKPYSIYEVVLYEDFAENTDLVVLYFDPYKMIFANYKDGKLEYIPLPDEELLTQINIWEDFGSFKVGNFDIAFLHFVYNSFKENKYDEVLDQLSTTDYPQLSEDEIDKWAEYYVTVNGNVDPFLDRTSVENAYYFDFNNDGILDILFITSEGSGRYAHQYVLQGTGDDKYIISHDAELNDSYHLIAPLTYNDTNYLLNSYTFEGSPVIYSSIAYIKSNGDTTNTKNSINVTNYLAGYKTTKTWTAEGYDNLKNYMLSRLGTANICSHSVMGTAETTSTEDNGKFVDVYNATGDYNNDGKDDNIQKIYGYFGDQYGFVRTNSDDQTINDTLDSLSTDGLKTTVFLDETEYGNLLFVAHGVYGRLENVNVFKITGETSELVGSIDLESINFTKISQ